jgi:hypothetical protein
MQIKECRYRFAGRLPALLRSIVDRRVSEVRLELPRPEWWLAIDNAAQFRRLLRGEVIRAPHSCGAAVER